MAVTTTKLGGAFYDLQASPVVGSLTNFLFCDGGALAQGTMVEADKPALDQARASKLLHCRSMLTMYPEGLEDKLVLHCDKFGTSDRRQTWVYINWGDQGAIPARIEGFFELEVNAHSVIFAVVRCAWPTTKQMT
jgi:hypothetical protein